MFTGWGCGGGAMTSLKAECRKFAPNIFNKSKCQNCFRGKDAHSTEALESNRATRKVSCCGYLFVAPDWDFSLPANRNKRWQRRWFVLFDDGELAYSLDEHPETVPQAVIDMNCVLEVADAETLTGNPFSLAVTCPDKVHFIKGTGKEDSKKWFEVLSKFPRNTVCGKYKRNATFPCLKSTPPVVKIETATPTPPNRRDTVDYPKLNGYGRKQPSAGVAFDPGDDVYPTKDTSAPLQKFTDKKKQDVSTPLQGENNCIRPDSHKSDVTRGGSKRCGSDVTRMLPTDSPWKKLEGGFPPIYLVMSDAPTRGSEKPRCLRRQSSFGKKSDLQKLLWSEEGGERTIHKSASVPNASILAGDSPPLKSHLSQIRGDPDGCNLDSMPSYCASTSEFNTEQSNEQGGAFLKKGWLVKQDACKWNKYWFVLRNSALTYFSDPIAEDSGILDGFLDLRKVRGVHEVESSSGHTFCVAMKDLSKLYLSAVTSKIRANWIRAILQAANLKPDKEDQDSVSLTPLPPSPPLARTAISRVKERAKTRSNSRTRSPKFSPSEVPEDQYLGDSDDGTTDHSSSSNPVTTTPIREKKATPKESIRSSKSPSEEKPRSLERRRSFNKSDPLLSGEGARKKATDIKDQLEDSSWSIWLDVSKFCREVECRLDDLESEKGDMGPLALSLGRVEERLRRVHHELERAKAQLAFKDSDLLSSEAALWGCTSLKREVSRLSGISSQNAHLAQQLGGAREEQRRLKAELRKSQDAADTLELRCASLRGAAEQADMAHRSQASLMGARVDDLTAKLLASEKTVRQLRQRVAKLEQRQERRRSSLKGKEGLSLSKEYEAKLAELEGKIAVVEGVVGGKGLKEDEAVQQSLLARLHTLDKKVKDVTETIVVASEEEAAASASSLPKPKIRLQVDEKEDDNWNSLSLSASMTDLTVTAEEEETPLSLTFGECIDSLGHKVASLVQWLKTSLQLLYAQGHIGPFQDPQCKINFEANGELSRLVRTLEFVTGQMEEPASNQGASWLLYHVALLQEAASTVYRLSDFDRYRAAVLAQHLRRVEQSIEGLEQYIHQKSVPSPTHKMSLCNVVQCLLHHPPAPTHNEGNLDTSQVVLLCDEVDGKQKGLAKMVDEFREKFVQRFCATILELSEDTGCDGSKPKQAGDGANGKPLGQKQFLAHISHIITQVCASFSSHLAPSPWRQVLQEGVQWRLRQLSSQVEGVCVRHLQPPFFSTPQCGVVGEYLHCCVAEIAQIVALVAVMEGTVGLVRKVLLGEENLDFFCSTSDSTQDTALHLKLQQRASEALCPSLPHGPTSPFPLCGSDVSVAHRSVSGLLCFRRKWSATQGEELLKEAEGLKKELQEKGTKCTNLELGLAEREEKMRQKDKQFEEEKEKLKQELHLAQSNIKKLEVQFDEESRRLQLLYEQKLQQKGEREDVRTRYAQEIQQIKSLCERGLSAMEASHHKLVCELERRHQGELEDILKDRERALQEEAHATHIALEAVRKAHSEELQKQVQKFKDEFVLKMNKRFETEAFKKCYESDLCHVREEIASVAEKYSAKCLENASLQQRMEHINQQLRATTTQVVELLAQNQQLQARLTGDTRHKKEESVR